MNDIGYICCTLYPFYDSICETWMIQWASYIIHVFFSLFSPTLSLMSLHQDQCRWRIFPQGRKQVICVRRILAWPFRMSRLPPTLILCNMNWPPSICRFDKHLDADHLLNAAYCSSEKEIFIKLFINLKTNYNLNFFLGWPQGTQGWWYKQCGSHEWADFSASGRAGGSSRRTKVTSTIQVTIAGYVILIWPWLYHTGKQK